MPRSERRLQAEFFKWKRIDLHTLAEHFPKKPHCGKNDCGQRAMKLITSLRAACSRLSEVKLAYFPVSAVLSMGF